MIEDRSRQHRVAWQSRAGLAALGAGLWLLTFASAIHGLERRQPALWQVSNAPAAAYLFGSLHFGKPSVYPLPEAVVGAFERAHVLALELDLDALTPSRQMAVIREHGTYPPGARLSTALGAEAWREVLGACAALVVRCEELETQRPWLAALNLALTGLARAGYAADSGIDRYFLGRARGRKQIVGLETIEEQLGFLAGLDEGAQGTYLLESVAALASLDSEVEALFATWLSGDVVQLDGLLNDELRGSSVAGLYAALIVSRNQRMARRLRALLEAGQPLFVVVGAAHLTGPESLVELLAAEGWDVERVPYQ